MLKTIRNSKAVRENMYLIITLIFNAVLNIVCFTVSLVQNYGVIEALIIVGVLFTIGEMPMILISLQADDLKNQEHKYNL